MCYSDRGANERFGAMLLETPNDAREYFDQDMVEAEQYSIAGGDAMVYSRRGPGKTRPNEDSAALVPFEADSGILVVADGLGGLAGGGQASNIAVRALRTALEHAGRDGVILRTAILNGIESANQKVQALGIGAATTLAIIEIDGDTIRPYHVGDSIILMVGKRGKIKLQTVSHSPVGFAVEAGFLDESEAMHHEDRPIVSNVIGTPSMRIEVGTTLKISTKDTLLLASDGLFDNLHVSEIADRLRKGPIDVAARRLAEDAGNRMISPAEGQPSKPDDLTFVAYRRPAQTRYDRPKH